MLPGYFDPSRWDIFPDPELWIVHHLRGRPRHAPRRAHGGRLRIILGVVFSLLRSSEIAWIRVPTAVVLDFLRGMPVLLMMLFILLVLSTDAFWAVVAAFRSTTAR